ncbi:YtxH domain-containing protein [Thermostaphylospora chromogena]|uniref:YtxH domain-containing protein n=1 Tax=Thermostaphylospora chromogena TaxID=35622 RepID=A0A1H1FU22_9ACTN|nr:YtxH domain-containing protein [Thermostaphylospora chromogena]SDR04199.1 hypothetical protein SAMN04489764_3170 [Thermostaphylospora chromogena]
MRYRMMFILGLAIGYVLGSRAGRERYEQIKQMAQRVADNPSVQETAGLVRAKATKAAGMARSKAEDMFGDRMPFRGRTERQESATGWPEEEKATVSKSPY